MTPGVQSNRLALALDVVHDHRLDTADGACRMSSILREGSIDGGSVTVM